MEWDLAQGSSTFGQLLRARRHQLGLSLAQLAARVHFDKGHVSKIETDKRPPSAVFAQACDRVLNAGNTFTSIAAALDATARQQQTWIHPAQLPAAPRNFVGRRRYLDQLDAVLKRDESSLGVPVAVIDGPPGVGKTALAVQWAHRAVDTGDFVDGQLFVNLRDPCSGIAAEPFAVLGDMLLALGVPAAQVPTGMEQRGAVLRSLLHGHKVLLVLDNAAEARQIRPLLPGFRGCAVVVTSRVELPGLTSQGAVTLTLPELSTRDGSRLVGSIIGRDRADADPAAVAMLSELCGHLPLALVWAAEHIVHNRHHSAAALAAELKSDPARLGLGDGEVTLRGVFDSSYLGLGEEPARLFRLLGLLPGPVITVADAAAIAGVDEAEALRLLRKLAGIHLIRHRDERRFQFHELLRTYAAELTKQVDTEADREHAMRRLAA